MYGASHTLAPLGMRVLEAHRTVPPEVLKVDPDGWKFVLSSLVLMDVENWSRGGRSGTRAHKSI